MIIQFSSKATLGRRCFIKTKLWEGRKTATELEMNPPQVHFSGLNVSAVLGYMISPSRKKKKPHSSCVSEAPGSREEGPQPLRAPWRLHWPLNHVHRHLGGGAGDRRVLPAVTGVGRLLVTGRRANHVHAVLHPRGQVLPLAEGPIGRRRTE